MNILSGRLKQVLLYFTLASGYAPKSLFHSQKSLIAPDIGCEKN